MADIRSPKVYAEAYADAIPDSVDGVKELATAGELLKNVPIIASYLLDRSISAEDKTRALKIALPDASDETRRFILILADGGAIKRLDRILKRTKEIYAEREDRMLAEVTSAVPLTNDEVTRIAHALHTRIGKAVLVETRIDESIKGGVTVRINDWLFDVSLRGRMERLEHALAE